MPQSPIPTSQTPAAGGISSALDVAAATVIKTGPGRLVKIIIQAVGTGGAFTLNDCAKTTDAAATNQITSLAYNYTGVVAGLPILLDLPFAVGLVVSAVGTSSGVVAVFYD